MLTKRCIATNIRSMIIILITLFMTTFILPVQIVNATEIFIDDFTIEIPELLGYLDIEVPIYDASIKQLNTSIKRIHVIKLQKDLLTNQYKGDMEHSAQILVKNDGKHNNIVYCLSSYGIISDSQRIMWSEQELARYESVPKNALVPIGGYYPTDCAEHVNQAGDILIRNIDNTKLYEISLKDYQTAESAARSAGLSIGSLENSTSFYVLALKQEDIDVFLQTEQLRGYEAYAWPGLNDILGNGSMRSSDYERLYFLPCKWE